MPSPNCFILYVSSPAESAALYTRLFDRPPVEQSPNFAMFALDGGVMLGLWARHDVQPPATPAGGAEIGLQVADAQAVRAVHDAWRSHGLPMAQAPTPMDFGFTFVAVDPDGHRLRVFAPPVA